jgi:hypothetical protein
MNVLHRTVQNSDQCLINSKFYINYTTIQILSHTTWMTLIIQQTKNIDKLYTHQKHHIKIHLSDPLHKRYNISTKYIACIPHMKPWTQTSHHMRKCIWKKNHTKTNSEIYSQCLWSYPVHTIPSTPYIIFKFDFTCLFYSTLFYIFIYYINYSM